MKQPKFTILIFAVLFSITSASFAQNVSTQGTDFWVSFMTNGHKYHSGAPNDGNWILTQVLISGKRDCSGTIANPQTGWSQDFTVQANSITTVDIPEDVAYVDGLSEQVTNKGLQITSNDTISVFCTNIAHLSFDASYVLPTQSLADDYIIQTYDQSAQSTNLPYVKENQTSAFLIVATEDGTIVDITPSVATLNGHGSGYEFSVNLNKGQVYQVRSNKMDGSSRDLSGTRVTSRNCKRIAVFNGNNLTAIPRNESSYDHIFEQAMPVQSWGKRFVVTKSLERSYDIVKIISASDNNEIYRNGTLIATINTGESHSFELNDASCFIEASGRAAVYLYNKSRDGNSIGDPSVLWIAPVEQRIDKITFSTFNNENINIDTHHVNIIVNTEDVGNVFLDNQRIPSSEFSPAAGNNEFSFARKNIQHGVHHLQCDNGFNAHVYGFGIAKGYAYLVGSKTEDLTVKVELNEILVQPNDTIDHCILDPVLFDATVNLLSYDLLWDFGDGTTSTQNPVTHNYNDKEFYEVSLIITTDEVGGCVFSTSDTLKFYIDGRQNYTTEEVEICKGELYSDHGFNVVVTNDTILEKAIENPEHPHCPDSLLVYITALPGYYASYNELLCWQGEPIIYNNHGFNITIDHPDTYTDQISVPIPGGCDSIIDLTLTVTDRIINPNIIEYSGCSESFTWNDITYFESGDYEQVFTSTMGCDSIIQLHIFLDEVLEGDTVTADGICSAYEWHGHIYEQTGFYTDTIPSALGCDSIVHLDLTLNHSPSPKIGCASSNVVVFGDTIAVITNTEFFSFQYDFYVEDTLNHIDDWESWVWHISKPSWMIEPFEKEDAPNKHYCRVYVAEHYDDYVELKATVFGCDTTSTTFYLKSSFFDIEEQNTEQPNFSIVPNPNKGKMDFHLNHMTGKVCFRVYDMKGILIDQIWVSNHTENSIIQYDLKHHATGIYYIIATAKEGTLTQKMVVLE